MDNFGGFISITSIEEVESFINPEGGSFVLIEKLKAI